MKPIAVREYEADQELWRADPAFARDLGIPGPLPPLGPPLVMMTHRRDEEYDWCNVEAQVERIRASFAPPTP